MWQFLKEFAGPIATIIASISALSVTGYFAWHQKQIAKEKLRLDLFDRRLEVFNSVFDFYDAVVEWKGSHEQALSRDRFFRARFASMFLFDKDSGIESIMGELYKKGMEVISFKENRDEIKTDPEFFKSKYDEVNHIQLRIFPDSLIELTAAIEKYVSFHKL